MKFKVLSLSYLFGELVPAGAVYDYPDDKLPRDAKGNIQFEKMSQLEPVGKKPVAKPVETDDDTDPNDDGDDNSSVVVPSGEERAQMIKDTVFGLDKTIDAHWTKTGLPSVDTINNLLGFNVTRKEVDAVAPDYIRPAE